jgi:hypothetical protein
MIQSTAKATLQIIASRLGLNVNDLHRLIQFESKWNPAAKNPLSSARGLLQFTDSSAVSLGYKNSLDLVNKNPTIEDQLFVVEKYLSRFKPFSGKQSLYMAVFYPAARNWNPGQLFPASVRAVNPGINTPRDYIRYVDGTIQKLAIIPIIGGAILIYFLLNRKAEQ